MIDESQARSHGHRWPLLHCFPHRLGDNTHLGGKAEMLGDLCVEARLPAADCGGNIPVFSFLKGEMKSNIILNN